MILKEGAEYNLVSRHFVVNIALPATTPDGILVMNRDPRKQRIKPATYKGIVEEAAADCKFVKAGDEVVLERWSWQQLDVDNERLVAREREVLVVNNQPAPNVMVLELIQKPPSQTLYVPDSYRPPKPLYYHGKILATNANEYFGLIGEELFIEAHGEGQFNNGAGLLFFQLGRGAQVLMRLDRSHTPQLQAV